MRKPRQEKLPLTPARKRELKKQYAQRERTFTTSLAAMKKAVNKGFHAFTLKTSEVLDLYELADVRPLFTHVGRKLVVAYDARVAAGAYPGIKESAEHFAAEILALLLTQDDDDPLLDGHDAFISWAFFLKEMLMDVIAWNRDAGPATCLDDAYFERLCRYAVSCIEDDMLFGLFDDLDGRDVQATYTQRVKD
jgi:hypothetical protein